MGDLIDRQAAIDAPQGQKVRIRNDTRDKDTSKVF